MNKANLKSYAPKARLDFIAAVTARANLLGISAESVLPADVHGDVLIIGGREWPFKVATQRDELLARIKRRGFQQTMEEVAYTWFNRFAALRYMEIHDYLEHGWRVLSSRDGGMPEILRHASEASEPGLNAARVRHMQLAGNQDNELYALLLVAQCNELSRAMPFLFERIDDATELLLPENLLRTDSIVSKLVAAVPEEDWQQIEVIGWLYQFYISEKKDEVIGKIVKSEDIPAATQLFTPNWIVQYLVQNSVGRLWLMTNPSSALASKWPYYVKPQAQIPEVQAELDALMRTGIWNEVEAVNPETITVLDPACGSAHILVVAYDVLKAIYLERGYQLRVIPRLILEKNLYGLDIDDRAVQLAAFALLMKARADDLHFFDEPPKMNVVSLQESQGLDIDALTTYLSPFGLQRAQLNALLDVFRQAKTFGSLIKMPPVLVNQLATMTDSLQKALRDGDLYSQQASKDVYPLVRQALVLAMQFDAVVANPRYMGSQGMCPALQKFVGKQYQQEKGDLFACFMSRSLDFTKTAGYASLVTLQSWMFLSSYEQLRANLLASRKIESLVQIGFNSFPTLNSKVALAAAVAIQKVRSPSYVAKYFNCNDASPSADKEAVFTDLLRGNEFYLRASETFSDLPGAPVSYWTTPDTRRVFREARPIADIARARQGLSTSNNEKFVRMWHEVSIANIFFDCVGAAAAEVDSRRWFPYNKGGLVRRWYGNNEFVVDWRGNGQEIKSLAPKSVVRNEPFYFTRSLTWSDITIDSAFRLQDPGFIFANSAHSAFCENYNHCLFILGLLNSPVVEHFIGALSQSLHFDVGYYNVLPLPAAIEDSVLSAAVGQLVSIARNDWDSRETSWQFQRPELVGLVEQRGSLLDTLSALRNQSEEQKESNVALERVVTNRAFEAYGLPVDRKYVEQSPKLVVESIDEGREAVRLVSYAIGCVMGRFSLDRPGLVYAHSGNLHFEASRYVKFAANPDGIVPNTDERWFEVDAASCVHEFLRAIGGSEKLEENMAWLAATLGAKVSETPDEAIRRYLANKFFKDHLQTYKKRPIYWLFSSGKQGAFQALVYLHRYHEGTLARLRAEFVVPLIAKVIARLEMLDRDAATASSASARSKIQKQMESLRKKQVELLAYDEKLRHFADMRIALDLDDGVKINYAKFGDLVAESKTITGGADD